jgi:hypothetical protein
MSQERNVVSLHEHAAANLDYIRETMRRAGSFTAVPGWGGVLMGLCGLAAAVIGWPHQGTWTWLWVWLAAAALAVVIGAVAVALKARASRTPSRPARQFAVSFAPPIFAGALLTIALAQGGSLGLLPGVWLLLYGTAVVCAGSYSAKIVPMMGVLFLFLGAIAIFSSAVVANVCLGVGFGLLHVVFGAIIARHHGG